MTLPPKVASSCPMMMSPDAMPVIFEAGLD